MKKKTKAKVSAKHTFAGIASAPLGHHLMSDWTVHGVIHEITHNGVYTAIFAALVMTGLELWRSRGGGL